jgi:hypothetical protein
VLTSQVRIEGRAQIRRAQAARCGGTGSPAFTRHISISERSASAGENRPATWAVASGISAAAIRQSRSAAARASLDSGRGFSPRNSCAVERSARTGRKSERTSACTMRTRARALGSAG